MSFPEYYKRNLVGEFGKFFDRIHESFYPTLKGRVLIMAHHPVNEEVVDDVVPSADTPIGDTIYVCVPVVAMFSEECYRRCLLTKITHRGLPMEVEVVELSVNEFNEWHYRIKEGDGSVTDEWVNLAIPSMIRFAVAVLGVDEDDCKAVFNITW